MPLYEDEIVMTEINFIIKDNTFKQKIFLYICFNELGL